MTTKDASHDAEMDQLVREIEKLGEDDRHKVYVFAHTLTRIREEKKESKAALT